MPRVYFTFDADSYKQLQAISNEFGDPSLAVTVRDALRLRRALREQLMAGYSELVLKNPSSGETRVLSQDTFIKI